MKAAVIYFSLEGHTKTVADKIAGELAAVTIPLIPVREYPQGKFSKYFWCGKSATFRERPKLKAYSFNPDAFDLIVLGTPIWAGTFTPPLRTFLRKNRLSGKRVALFASCSGGPTEKCFEQLKKEMPGCTLLSTLRVVNPVKNADPENDGRIADFCTRLKP